MTLYKKQYRVETTRLKNNAYSSGMFFVTVCTWKKLQWFGEVKNGRMLLNQLGSETEKCWKNIPDHFPYVKLDSFAVMPNHVHGIIHVGRVEPQNFAALQQPKNSFGPQSKNLASIIRGYKIGVKKAAREVGHEDFRWQSRFYDRVIRSRHELKRIQAYINKNPTSWDKETIPWHTDATYFGL